jgi:4-amino-4-deoxy-L-arabinose transferase-like glycosyltransferase
MTPPDPPPALVDNAATRNRLTPRDRLLLTLLALLILLPGTFGVSLFDRDEGWYAQVSREMLASGDWLVPTYLGHTWLAKPPLLYWCVSAAWSILGVNEFAARLVNVIATTLTVQLIAALGAAMLNRRAGLLAAVAYITAGLPALVGKMLLTDPLMLLFATAAQLTLFRMAADRVTVTRGLLFWGCVGLSALAKGPAVVVFVGAFALAMLVGPAGRHWVRAPRLWLTLPVALLVAGPWFAYITAHEGPVFLKQFLGYEVVSRIAGTPHGHGGPPGYYLLLSIVGLLPWTALVPGVVIDAIARFRTDPITRVLVIWCLLPWIVLELIHSKLPHYIVPCYIPLALLLGRSWDAILTAPPTDREPTTAERAVLALWIASPAAAGTAFLVVALVGSHFAFALPAAVTGLTLVAGTFLIKRALDRRRLAAALAAAAGTGVAFQLLVGLWLLPSGEPLRLARNVANRANELAPPDAVTFVAGFEEPTLFFYLDRPARTVTVDRLADLYRRPPRPCLLIARAKDFKAAGIQPDNPPDQWTRVRGFNYVKMRMVPVYITTTQP